MLNKWGPIIVLNGAIGLLGLSGLFARLIDLPAVVIIAGRSLVASLFLGGVCVVFKQWRPIRSVRDRGMFLFVGLIMTLHWVLFYQSVQVSSVAVGVISIYTYPLILAFLEPLLSKQAITMRHVIQGVLVVIAMVVLSFHSLDSGTVTQGIGYGLLSAMCLAIRNICSKQLTKRYSPVAIMWIQVMIASGCLVPFFTPQLITAGSTNIMLMVVAGVLISGIAHTLFVTSIAWLSVTTVGIMASFQIVIATGMAWWWLGDAPSWPVIIGGGMILSVVIYEQIVVLSATFPKIDNTESSS